MVVKAKTTKKPAGKKKLSVNFEGVEAGGGSAIPDGTYSFEIVSIEEKESSEGNPYLSAKMKITEGKHKGATAYDNFSLQPQALWKLRTLLEVLGYEVPEGEMEIEIEDLVGEKFDGVITNEKYEGKNRPRITQFISLGTEEEEAEEEEESDDEPEEEEEEEEEAEEEEEEKPKGKASKKTVGKKAAPKFKVGAKVTFRDEKNKLVKATVTAVNGDTVQVVDSKEEEWEVDASELEAA